MTLQEAIEALKLINLKRVHPFYSWEEMLEVRNLAIEALEKQVPEKANIWGDGYSDGELVYDMYDCPNCGKSYELDYQEYLHCPSCGQAIDWSEGE